CAPGASTRRVVRRSLGTPQHARISPLSVPIEGTTERNPATEQLLDITAVLSDAIEKTDLDPTRREGERLDRFHIVRLRLLSTALLARYTEELITIRDINLLY
ncbi:MAG: hypothetical protein M3Y74_18275, partial [Chloroflexota bacterium]|nr:hypothetical protein [Chloroflexota bacterium]